MKTTSLVMAVAVAAGALGCHRATQQAQLTPPPMADSLAAARAREDSLALAAQRARADSLAAARRADSLAAARERAAAELKTLAELIHFDFDKATLRLEDAQELDHKTAILRANPSVRIRIAGNCDERGSDEYNLALGNRRAITAKTYLVNHGVAADRIEIGSYGKERPIDPAHNEVAWAMDRNDQFVDLTTNVGLR